MQRLALFLFIFSCSLSSSLPTVAILSMSVVGNIIILLTSSPARVHALHVAPFSSSSPPPSLRTLNASTPRTTISSHKLFGTRSRRNVNDRLVKLYSSSSSAPNGNGGESNSAVNAETANSSQGGKSAQSSSTSFLRAVDSFGMNLKPWALKAYEKSLSYSSTGDGGTPNVNGTDAGTGQSNGVKSFMYRLQANVLWILYIIYRGYRGFFVILPAVFREVYRKLEESELVVDVYGDEEEEEKEYAVNANAEQQQPRQQPMRLRTRVTISVLSGMLTLSYVVSGAFRVLGKFIKTFTNTTSVESSLEEAAAEIDVNEDKLRNKL